MRLIHFFIKIFIILCLFASCARPVAPTGGRKDKTPPHIVKEKSTENFQTNFEKQPIQLTFDEYVVLKDLGKQVLISPPLGKAFNVNRDIKLKGRTVSIDFDESILLRDSTTYTINFGTAIQDLNEGNPAKGMRFVFSTGPYLDSLSLKGKVVDAYSSENQKDVSVMLYDEKEPDSLVTKGLPYYIAQSDENGAFSFQNLSAGRYRIVAIEENFVNQRWDGENERIGFFKEVITLPDTNRINPKIRLFSEQTDFKKIGQSNVRYGFSWIAYNANPDSLLPPITAEENVELFHKVSGDTVYIYYKNPPITTWQMWVGEDTLDIRPSPDSIYFAENPLAFNKANTVTKRKPSGRKARTKDVKKAPRTISSKSIQSTETAIFQFNRPLAAVDTNLCALVIDSSNLRKPNLYIDSLDRRVLHVSFPWKGANTYNLDLFPESVTDWYGEKTKDTISIRVSVIDPEQLSNLEIEITECIVGRHYWVELSKDEKTVDRTAAIHASDSTSTITFNSLTVSPYFIRVIEDLNANQRWDAGSYTQKRQAERIFTKKVESLKPNWSVNTTIELTENIKRINKSNRPKTNIIKKE